MNTSAADQRLAAFQEIPIIDIHPLLHGDEQARREVAAELGRAARDVGFFQMVGHGIDGSLREGLIHQAKRFFAQSEAIKMERYIGLYHHHRGYVPPGEESPDPAKPDMKEAFDLAFELPSDDPDVLAGLPLVHPNQWPDGEGAFLRDGILPYYEAVMALGRRILTCLAGGLGIDPQVVERAYERPLGRGQLVYYPALDAADVAAQRFGAAEHSDFGVLTILQQDDLGGLQVRNRSGDWIEALPIENTFVCNIGDLLERWTNGRLVSTPHRVLNRSGRSRFSIPIFCDPASDAVIDPRDFDPAADIDTLPPIAAGAYIAGKNRRNFSHYDRSKS